jgi:adenosylcobinamide-GDP ribazoletransferase
MIDQPIRTFYIALSFLTRIPVSIDGHVTQKQMGDAIVFYPLVGAIIGLCCFLLSELILFFSSNFPSGVLAALLLSFWVILTGGLHLDGLADSADAWVGGLNNRDRTLEIMKDPYCGPIGVAVVVLVLLLKFSALSYLLNTGNTAFLIVLPMLSRSVIIVLFMSTVYVRDSGLGSALLEFLPTENILWLIILISIFVYIIFANVLSFCLLAISVFLLRLMMIKRIGGMTGDTLGATIEIAEAVALLGLVF